MKLAIMQPYFFPYAGYFQLMANVDLFVFLDDVQYIRRGWINRNKINKNTPTYITVPINKTSQSAKINEISICHGWVDNHLKYFIHLYGNKIKENIVFRSYQDYEKYDMLSHLNCESLKMMAKILNVKTAFEFSSNYPSDEKGEDRILQLCKLFKANEYCNLPGGRSLYDEIKFQNNGIKLNFIDTSYQDPISIIESLFHGNANNLRLQ